MCYTTTTEYCCDHLTVLTTHCANRTSDDCRDQNKDMSSHVPEVGGRLKDPCVECVRKASKLKVHDTRTFTERRMADTDARKRADHQRKMAEAVTRHKLAQNMLANEKRDSAERKVECATEKRRVEDERAASRPVRDSLINIPGKTIYHDDPETRDLGPAELTASGLTNPRIGLRKQQSPRVLLGRYTGLSSNEMGVHCSRRGRSLVHWVSDYALHEQIGKHAWMSKMLQEKYGGFTPADIEKMKWMVDNWHLVESVDGHPLR